MTAEKYNEVQEFSTRHCKFLTETFECENRYAPFHIYTRTNSSIKGNPILCRFGGNVNRQSSCPGYEQRGKVSPVKSR